MYEGNSDRALRIASFSRETPLLDACGCRPEPKRLASVQSWLIAVITSLAFGAVAVADDSCGYALDNQCDEPEICAPGTDTTDCQTAASDPQAQAGIPFEPYAPEYSDGPTFFEQLWWMTPGIRVIVPFAFAIGAFVLWRARQFPGRFPLMLGMALVAGASFVGVSGLGQEWMYMGIGVFEVVAAVLVLAGVVMLVRWLGAGPAAGAAAAVVPAVAESPSMQQVLRSETNAISESAKAIADLEQRLRALLEKLGISAEVFATSQYQSAQQVRVVLNELQREPLGIRSMISITAVPREYHRFPVELTVQVQNTLRTRMFHSVLHITDDELATLCNFIAGRAERLKFRPKRARLFPLQFWRPKNKQTAVITAGWLVALGAAILVAILQIVPALGLVIVLVVIVGWIIHLVMRVPPLALSAGKPLEEPRRLVRLDSWHVVVSELAAHAESIRESFISELRRAQETLAAPQASDYGGANEIAIGEEKIWYETIDGRFQRVQTVIRLRRAIAFVHLYGYGRDAFFAWDAHINAGGWYNVPVATGRHSQSGKLVTAYAIEPRWTAPNEYDLTDANFLSELVHANLAKVIRAAMKDNQIDQEVDFTIVRADREGVIGMAEPGARKRRPSLMKRTA